MRAVLQRVTRARVLVDGSIAGEIGPGLMALIAVGREDTAATASSMAEKIVNLRIFGDEQGKMNRSLLDTGGAIKGPVRGDLFWGAGKTAEAQAGAMQSRGRYFILLPGDAPDGEK